MMRSFGMGLVLLTGLLMAGCGDSQDVVYSAKLKGMDVQVELSPNPPTPGYNEFKVTVHRSNDWHPVDDVIVEMGVHKGPNDPITTWRQGMQDGLLGIYRRAVEIPGPGHWEAVIRIRKGKMEQQTSFPLDIAP